MSMFGNIQDLDLHLISKFGSALLLINLSCINVYYYNLLSTNVLLQKALSCVRKYTKPTESKHSIQLKFIIKTSNLDDLKIFLRPVNDNIQGQVLNLAFNGEVQSQVLELAIKYENIQVFNYILNQTLSSKSMKSLDTGLLVKCFYSFKTLKQFYQLATFSSKSLKDVVQNCVFIRPLYKMRNGPDLINITYSKFIEICSSFKDVVTENIISNNLIFHVRFKSLIECETVWLDVKPNKEFVEYNYYVIVGHLICYNKNNQADLYYNLLEVIRKCLNVKWNIDRIDDDIESIMDLDRNRYYYSDTCYASAMLDLIGDEIFDICDKMDVSTLNLLLSLCIAAKASVKITRIMSVLDKEDVVISLSELVPLEIARLYYEFCFAFGILRTLTKSINDRIKRTMAQTRCFPKMYQNCSPSSIMGYVDMYFFIKASEESNIDADELYTIDQLIWAISTDNIDVMEYVKMHLDPFVIKPNLFLYLCIRCAQFAITWNTIKWIYSSFSTNHYKIVHMLNLFSCYVVSCNFDVCVNLLKRINHRTIKCYINVIMEMCYANKFTRLLEYIVTRYTGFLKFYKNMKTGREHTWAIWEYGSEVFTYKFNISDIDHYNFNENYELQGKNSKAYHRREYHTHQYKKTNAASLCCKMKLYHLIPRIIDWSSNYYKSKLVCGVCSFNHLISKNVSYDTDFYL